MVDFLKAYPFISIEQYKWELSISMIRIMSADNTHVNYLSEEEVEMRKAKHFDGSNNSMLNDLGIPIL